jgi:hypothetical protein
MPDWLTHFGSFVRNEVFKCVTSLHKPHWLPAIEKDVRDALVQFVVVKLANSAWNKVTAFSKKYRSKSTAAIRSQSAGLSFSQPAPTASIRTHSVVNVFSQPVNITGGSIAQVK